MAPVERVQHRRRRVLREHPRVGHALLARVEVAAVARELDQLQPEALVPQHDGTPRLEQFDHLEQVHVLVGHEVRRAHGAAAVDAEIAVHQHVGAAPLRLVDEGKRLDEVLHDVVLDPVLGGDRQVRLDAGAARVRRLLEVEPPRAGAVQHERDVESLQRRDVVGVLLVADVQVRRQLHGVLGRPQQRVRLEDLAHLAQVLAVLGLALARHAAAARLALGARASAHRRV